MLFAEGFGKEVSRANQGWAILYLFLWGISRERRGERKEFIYPPGSERGKGRDWRKARFFLLLLHFGISKKFRNVGDV